MQVPEKLALIGGSILLASTLVFTLKSQASQILPRISDASNKIFDHIGDTHKSDDFDSNYQKAQKKGWKTGMWGSAKYYIDDQHNMHVGTGTLGEGHSNDSDGLRKVIGDDATDSLLTINIDQPVKAPRDSTALFSTARGYRPDGSRLNAINGLDKVDTSHVNVMFNMFSNDSSLQRADGASTWDVSHVTDFRYVFNHTSLAELNLSKWDTTHANSLFFIYGNNGRLGKIIYGDKDTGDMLANGVMDNTGLTGGQWKNKNNAKITYDFQDSPSSGTWIKQ